MYVCMYVCLHIGQWAMGNGRQKSLPIAHCLLPRSTKLAFFGQWAMGCGWLHAHKFASYRILPCATWAMGNEHFFPAHCNCPLLSVAQWLHSWAMGIGRYATCVAHLVAWAAIWGIFAAQMGNGQRGRVTLSQCKHRRPLPIAQYASSLLIL